MHKIVAKSSLDPLPEMHVTTTRFEFDSGRNKTNYGHFHRWRIGRGSVRAKRLCHIIERVKDRPDMNNLTNIKAQY
jgi:hypothetical protein